MRQLSKKKAWRKERIEVTYHSAHAKWHTATGTFSSTHMGHPLGVKVWMSFYEYKDWTHEIVASDSASARIDMNCESPQFQSRMPHFGITLKSKKKPWEELEEILNGSKILTIYEILRSA